VTLETGIANQLGVILGCILEGWALTSAGCGVLFSGERAAYLRYLPAVAVHVARAGGQPHA